MREGGLGLRPDSPSGRRAGGEDLQIAWERVRSNLVAVWALIGPIGRLRANREDKIF